MADPDTNNIGIRIETGRNVFSWHPRVSIVIPAYNVAEFIAETLDSVLAQKFKDHEIIVVNDGSPDTPEFERAISRYRQEIIYVKQPSVGAGAARNTAIRHARGEIIAFLDGDDIWQPDFLASQVAFLGSGYDMVYCDAYQFGLRSALRKTFMETAPSDGEVTAEALLDYRCNVITSGTIALKSALERAGLFEQQRTRAHDFHLWVRMAKTGSKIGYQRKPLLKYRVHLASLSGDAISRVERELAVFNRIVNTVELTAEEREIIDRRVSGLDVDLQIEFGKSYLISEQFADAHRAFAAANRQRRSAKLTAITWLARIAPRRLLQHFQTRRREEIPFIRRQA
ncbi:MAG: glycosyltransferase family A protein [Acidobacteriota bacterium]